MKTNAVAGNASVLVTVALRVRCSHTCVDTIATTMFFESMDGLVRAVYIAEMQIVCLANSIQRCVKAHKRLLSLSITQLLD